jgi:exodeoxyribonuclease VII large subunit
MTQPSLFTNPSLTVTELTRRVRRLLEGDAALQDAWVKGEISNFVRASSGHLYFTLKDAGASLKCVMWRSDAARMRLPLQDGQQIEAHGKVAVYEPSGQYQLVTDNIRMAGEGALFAEFMRLKAMLEAEGLFAPERKRPIPEFPRKIGIITSPTGAAIRDMLHALARRHPLAEVTLAPAPVQGADAPPALVLALQKLNTLVQPDVILLARGGGSIEDLWAFNDERVIRAVAESRAPIITGVGHETDFTLADFAADLRAPTPTAAAELATRITINDLRGWLQAYKLRLDETISRRLDEEHRQLDAVRAQLRYFSPARRVATERQRLDDLARRLEKATDRALQLERSKLEGAKRRLKALNPLEVLKRGYSIVTLSQGGSVVLTARQAAAGTNIHIQLAEGTLSARVIEREVPQDPNSYKGWTGQLENSSPD